MKRIIPSRLSLRLLILPLLFSIVLSAQRDSIIYNSDFKFKEGLYLNYTSFITNNPIPKAAIVSDYNHAELDFLRKTVLSKTVFYKDSSGKVQEINPGKLWGFSENNSPYIRFNGDFNKIVVIGNLCHFTALYTTYLNSTPGNISGPTTGTPVESMQQYVLDTQTGNVMDFVLPNMELLIKRDPDLYKEFMAIKKGKRRQMMFFYLRKYNEKHPLYFYK